MGSKNGFGIYVVPGFDLKKPFLGSPMTGVALVQRKVPVKIGKASNKLIRS